MDQFVHQAFVVNAILTKVLNALRPEDWRADELTDKQATRRKQVRNELLKKKHEKSHAVDPMGPKRRQRKTCCFVLLSLLRDTYRVDT